MGACGGKFRGDGSKLVPKVGQVGGLRRLDEEFVDDGLDVVESGDGREWCSARRAEGPACDGEEEGRLYDLERDAAIVEGAGQLAVTAAQVAGGSWSEAIEVEDSLDVEPARVR